MARASGIRMDTRLRGEHLYDQARLRAGRRDRPATASPGCSCACARSQQSIDLIRQADRPDAQGRRPPDRDQGPRHARTGETFTRLEQPRGEVIYYVKANGTKFLERFRARTPTFANIPAMIKLVKGCDLADVPNIVLTIDPCISCTER